MIHHIPPKHLNQNSLFSRLREASGTELHEGQYLPPKSGATRMFDLYALYAMWWEFGSGREAYGHQPKNVVHDRLRKRIDFTFEYALDSLARDLVNGLHFLVYDEITRHIVELDGVTDKQSVLSWLNEQGYLGRVFHLSGERISTVSEAEFFDELSQDEIHELLLAPLWQEFYAGEAWVRISLHAGEGITLFEGDKTSVEQRFEWVRALTQMEHNTDYVLNKMPSLKLNPDLCEQIPKMSLWELKECASETIAEIAARLVIVKA